MAVVVQAGDARLCVDVAATVAVYRSVREPGCGCCLCENFRAAWESAAGGVVEGLLRNLGVDPGMPAEIVHYCRLSPGRHLYTAEWAVIGAPAGDSEKVVTWEPPRVGLVLEIRADGVPASGAFKDDPRTRWLMLTVPDVPWVTDHPEPA